MGHIGVISLWWFFLFIWDAQAIRCSPQDMLTLEFLTGIADQDFFVPGS